MGYFGKVIKGILLFAVLFSVTVQITEAHVELDFPEGGEVFLTGETITIEWTEEIEHNTSKWILEYSVDGGSSWNTIDEVEYENTEYQWKIPDQLTEEARVRVTQVNPDYNNFTSASDNFHIRESTSIDDKPDRNPIAYKLSKNHPNPFNPSTTIRYSLPKATKMELSIYNLSGRKISTLVNGKRSRGTHSIRFNAENLSSGIYLYRIKTPDFSSTRKMILMK